jgi:hypothetical protein
MKVASSRGIDNKFLELLSLRRKKDDLKKSPNAPALPATQTVFADAD